MWFLPCLFITQILLYWIIRLSKDKEVFIFISITVGLLIGTAYMLAKLPMLPWEIECSFVALFFVGLGYLLKKKKIIINKTKKIELACIFVIVNISSMYANYIYMGKHSVDLGGDEIGMPILFLLESLSAIFALIIVFSSINKIGVLSYIGKNSLIYYCLVDTMAFIPNIIVFNILNLEMTHMGLWAIPINMVYAVIICLSIVPINELINRKLKFMKGQF